MWGAGYRTDKLIHGNTVLAWYELFSLCHEYHTDGGQFQKKMSLRNVMNIKTGYYTRICLPYKGTVLDQPHVITHIFNIIKDELERMMRHRMK